MRAKRLACIFLLALATLEARNRVLPLNRFPHSRQLDTGFYYMPAAIGDDYFDGTDPPARIRRHLQTARKAGARYLRCAFSWNGIEKEQGKYNWKFWDALVTAAEQHHVGLIPYVAYTPEWAARSPKDFWKQPPREPRLYADFMKRAAARYRGRIPAWEIWNEPDNKDYWTGTVDEFAELVTLAAPAIREADPRAVLILGGVANGPGPFFRRMIVDLHLGRYVDVVAAHGYPESWLHERAETVFQEWIPAMHQMIAADGSGADLWFNEMGYADYRLTPNQASIYGTQVFYDYEHTRHYQAAMLFKFYVMTLASEQVSLAGWYRIDDFPRSETRLGTDFVNFHLGVLDARARPKPALAAMSLFNRLFRKPSLRVETTLTSPPGSMSVVNVFRTAGNRMIVVGWLRSSEPDEVAVKTGLLRDRRAESVTAALPCANPAVIGYYDLYGNRSSTSAAQLRQAALRNIPLRGNSVFIAELGCRSSVLD